MGWGKKKKNWRRCWWGVVTALQPPRTFALSLHLLLLLGAGHGRFLSVASSHDARVFCGFPSVALAGCARIRCGYLKERKQEVDKLPL